MQPGRYTFTPKPIPVGRSQTLQVPTATLYVPKVEERGLRRAVQASTGRIVQARQLTAKCVVIRDNDRFRTGRAGDYLVRLPSGLRTIMPRARFEAEYAWLDGAARRSAPSG